MRGNVNHGCHPCVNKVPYCLPTSALPPKAFTETREAKGRHLDVSFQAGLSSFLFKNNYIHMSLYNLLAGHELLTCMNTFPIFLKHHINKHSFKHTSFEAIFLVIWWTPGNLIICSNTCWLAGPGTALSGYLQHRTKLISPPRSHLAGVQNAKSR